MNAQAHARIGLLGNPSDGYGGCVLAFAIRDFTAHVELQEHAGCAVLPGTAHARAAGSVEELGALLESDRPAGGAELLIAAAVVLGEHCRRRGLTPPGDFALRFRSDVPRQVGLAGSSAIVVATLRALAEHRGLWLPPTELAELALEAESGVLGIAAGPQDRVAQAHQGFLWMDFRRPRGPDNFRQLPPSLLPPVFLAWDPQPGTSSGVAHDDVRARWQRDEPEVVHALETFAALARDGLGCLQRSDLRRFRALLDRSFATRASIWPLGDADREMVRIGRALGAAVKLCGSGGAVVGVPAEPGDFDRLAAAYAEAGYRWRRPELAPALDAAPPPSPHS